MTTKPRVSDLVGDNNLEAAHVEDDRNHEAAIVDTEDKEEYFVKPLYTYYCGCGHMAMITDTLLARLPLRKLDGARVVDPTNTTAKVFAAAGDTVYVRRAGLGLEQQYRKNCKGCAVPLFYQHPFNNKTLTFIFRDALLSAQEVGGFSGANEEQRLKKVIMTKHVKNQGKMGSVTVSTVEEQEADKEHSDMSESYSLNARLVRQHMHTNSQLKERIMGRDQAGERDRERKRGTLL